MKLFCHSTAAVEDNLARQGWRRRESLPSTLLWRAIQLKGGEGSIRGISLHSPALAFRHKYVHIASFGFTILQQKIIPSIKRIDKNSGFSSPPLWTKSNFSLSCVEPGSLSNWMWSFAISPTWNSWDLEIYKNPIKSYINPLWKSSSWMWVLL